MDEYGEDTKLLQITARKSVLIDLIPTYCLKTSINPRCLPLFANRFCPMSSMAILKKIEEHISESF